MEKIEIVINADIQQIRENLAETIRRIEAVEGWPKRIQWNFPIDFSFRTFTFTPQRILDTLKVFEQFWK
jgi:hypothetical protein